MGIALKIKTFQACQILTGVWLLFAPMLVCAASPEFSFFVTADFGPNGLKSNHKTVAAMAKVTQKNPPAFVLQLGDFFHQNGVSSTNDKRWKRLFEKRVLKVSPDIQWKGVLGNHEYRGNTQSILDYARLNPRWDVPSRYYTFVCQANDSVSIRFVVFDTSPLISGYRKNTKTFPDARLQDPGRQLRWADSVLTVSKESLVIALGHHPVVYAGNPTGTFDSDTTLTTSEPLMGQFHSLLEKHRVDFYFSGHRHNVQYIRSGSDGVQYLIVPTGSQPKPVRDSNGVRLSLAASSDPALLFYLKVKGFVRCAVKGTTLHIEVLNTKGEIIYSIKKVLTLKKRQ